MRFFNLGNKNKDKDKDISVSDLKDSIVNQQSLGEKIKENIENIRKIKDMENDRIDKINKSLNEYGFSIEPVGKNFLNQSLFKIKTHDGFLKRNIITEHDIIENDLIIYFSLNFEDNEGNIKFLNSNYVEYNRKQFFDFILDKIFNDIIKDKEKEIEFLNRNQDDVIDKELYNSIKNKLVYYNNNKYLKNKKIEEMNSKLKEFGLYFEEIKDSNGTHISLKNLEGEQQKFRSMNMIYDIYLNEEMKLKFMQYCNTAAYYQRYNEEEIMDIISQKIAEDIVDKENFLKI